MVPRLAGALAVVGGTAWLVKVALIWDNSGTNTTDGMVGVLFDIGAIAIASAAVLRAWYWRAATLPWRRLLAVLIALVAFLAAMNLPILLARQVFGRTWYADEVGILLTAAGALVLGVGWLRAGFRVPQQESQFG